MAKAELNSEFIATVAGDIIVYNYNGESYEYLSSSVEYLAVGVGIPALSCTDAPGEEKDGFAICRTADFTAWEYVADYRGETVYNTKSGEALVVSLLGNYPKETTTLAPSTPYDTWNGSEWVTDTDAKHSAAVKVAAAEKQSRIDQANDYINNKQWPGKAAMGRLTDLERSQYNEWLDYLDVLEEVNISTAPNVIWSEKPE
ncbi:tail fiber assembly protein [Cronobacter sakazakii]|nr:tail fiber assembly protein [Cronobacter sakazakii]ELY2539329.1 tail fiber assembly protein [Cronobacter sakazakii]ELY4822119.1 tail fiber assembly protein [Cronobacter sakazakii]ELY4838507.1 tail fiber assembly protein [Cronobacter sakazakii]ELY5864102.1 tail fiber assembly protein [Cronobacter sakazakii]